MPTTVNVRNGIDVTRLLETVEAINADDTLAAFTFRARSTWREGTHNIGEIGGFTHAGEEDRSRAAAFVLDGDEPPVLLGNNSGPNAVELLLQALAFCYAVGYVANAAARGIQITRMDYEIEGDFDVRPFLGLDGPRPGFTAIRAKAIVSSPNAAGEQLQDLCRYVQETSPVRDCLANAIPVETTLDVVQPRRSDGVQGVTMTSTSIDVAELEAKVKGMYRAVALQPHGTYHFEMGRPLAERLGYPADLLDRIPSGAVESFAGVGHFFDLVHLRPGDRVLDLGSGSGMDAFVAALLVGPSGRVVGVDMTPEQLAKAGRLRTAAGMEHVTFVEGRIEALPFDDAGFDAVISNGVINLAADKPRVFAEAARVLRPGGLLAVADIVSEVDLPPGIVGNTDLWASCIGGATQRDTYLRAVEAAGLRVDVTRRNPYEFLSGSARGASATYGVVSISLLARKAA